MSRELLLQDEHSVQALIGTIRGCRVILAADLAALYGVQTKALNQAFKRNSDRFPEDFVFRLTRDEADAAFRSRSQTVTLKRGSNIKYLPYAFTEHGALMAANVLNSPRAVQMSVFVVRAFIKMRETLAGNKALMEKLAVLEKKLTSRLDIHEKAIVHVLGEIKRLMAGPEQPKRKIGFKVKEARAGYGVKRKRQERV
jgi:phage regulator Rha-like protein